MKNRIANLLIIFGALIATVLSPLLFSYRVPLQILIIIGGFCLGFSYVLFTSVYSGTIWGIEIKCSNNDRKMKIIGAIGLVLGGFSIICLIYAILIAVGSFNILLLIVDVACFVVPVIIGPPVGKTYLEKSALNDNGNEVLDQFPIFSHIDSNMEQAVSFVVSYEGVALYSKANYCYAVYLYEDYELGTLSTPEEVALVGAYFLQKYGKDYTFKVDMKVIPGEPGQTVVAVGTGGVGIARTSGTLDKRIFRSYIFTKRK